MIQQNKYFYQTFNEMDEKDRNLLDLILCKEAPLYFQMLDFIDFAQIRQFILEPSNIHSMLRMAIDPMFIKTSYLTNEQKLSEYYQNNGKKFKSIFYTVISLFEKKVPEICNFLIYKQLEKQGIYLQGGLLHAINELFSNKQSIEKNFGQYFYEKDCFNTCLGYLHKIIKYLLFFDSFGVLQVFFNVNQFKDNKNMISEKENVLINFLDNFDQPFICEIISSLFTLDEWMIKKEEIDSQQYQDVLQGQIIFLQKLLGNIKKANFDEKYENTINLFQNILSKKGICGLHQMMILFTENEFIDLLFYNLNSYCSQYIKIEKSNTFERKKYIKLISSILIIVLEISKHDPETQLLESRVLSEQQKELYSQNVSELLKQLSEEEAEEMRQSLKKNQSIDMLGSSIVLPKNFIKQETFNNQSIEKIKDITDLNSEGINDILPPYYLNVCRESSIDQEKNPNFQNLVKKICKLDFHSIWTNITSIANEEKGKKYLLQFLFAQIIETLVSKNQSQLNQFIINTGILEKLLETAIESNNTIYQSKVLKIFEEIRMKKDPQFFNYILLQKNNSLVQIVINLYQKNQNQLNFKDFSQSTGFFSQIFLCIQKIINNTQTILNKQNSNAQSFGQIHDQWISFYEIQKNIYVREFSGICPFSQFNQFINEKFKCDKLIK